MKTNNLSIDKLALKTKVTLVYPYFHSRIDNSIFRFPPLGLGYIASYLKQNGVSVDIVDCTFIDQEEALRKIKDSNPTIIGIQSMFSMRKKTLELAKLLKKDCQLLVAGGPLPTVNPDDFLEDFDVVVSGEGEVTMLELVKAFENGGDFSQIQGLTFKDVTGKPEHTARRDLIRNIDSLPFPAREKFDNSAYMRYYKKKFGYAITPIMTSRGCPYKCDFCSRPIFGNEFRMRTAANIINEIKETASLGYDRLWFADDCFTLNRQRLIEVCNKIIGSQLKIEWECLSRIDTLDSELVSRMKKAGCIRIFFGIESGDDSILAKMGKGITAQKAKEAVLLCNKQGVKVGAFFILGYPGENDKTLLNTVKFASSLQLDYLSFTLPFPIPGTPLFERLKDDVFTGDKTESDQPHLLKRKLLFRSSVSESKLKFAIIKAMTHFYVRKYLGKRVHQLMTPPFELVTDAVLRVMR